MPKPAIILFIEFDDLSERLRQKQVKHLKPIFEDLASGFKIAENYEQRTAFWKVRQASASLLAHGEGKLRAIPVIDDAAVPTENLAALIKGAHALFASEKMQIAVWGSAGDGTVHIHPFIDLSELGNRQRAFRLYEEYYKLVLSLGGTTSGQHGDGRLRAPLLPKVYGPEVYALFQKLKKIFDPYNTLNPGVKIDVTMEQVRAELRQSYELGHLHNFMPRS